MIYRPYKPDDFASLYAVEERCFQPPFRFERKYMRQLVGCLDGVTWIAEEDGRLAGFAIAEWQQGPGEVMAYIQTIEVVPEQRGQGVGGELLRHIEDSARTTAACLIWLHVDAENDGAIRLYQAHGYRGEGREESYYAIGRAALIFVKLLGGVFVR